MTDTANAPERNDELQSDRPFIVGWNLGFAEAEYQQAHGKPSDGDLSPQYQYTAAEMAEAQAKIARLTEALKEMSIQKKTSELDTEYDVECADFEAGYDTCIDRARAALQENANG